VAGLSFSRLLLWSETRHKLFKNLKQPGPTLIQNPKYSTVHLKVVRTDTGAELLTTSNYIMVYKKFAREFAANARRRKQRFSLLGRLRVILLQTAGRQCQTVAYRY
jgi:hypothetical protein